MEFKDYKYIFPPRPENAIPPKDLDFWNEQPKMVYQPKYNGSNCTIYTNGESVYVMNRHRDRLSNFSITRDEIIENLYKKSGLFDKWLVLNGEYLNKNKSYINGESFNHKFIIFDILVYDKWLVKSTFSDRLDILNKIYLPLSGDELMDRISDNCFLTKTFVGNMTENFNKWIELDLIEGLVIKNSKSPLEPGFVQKNNVRWQIKCRKATKNYRY
jgi:hypothetical protein